MRFPHVTLTLPEWLESTLPAPDHVFATTEDRMRLAIELARHNVDHGTGGPFGAAIFERQTGTLLAPGVNLVVPSNCSVAHAEIVAIMLAQTILGCYHLGANRTPSYELVTSTEPCAMCMGAIPWSGIQSLVCGARDEDARAIGMDEGDKPADWIAAYQQRGIRVQRDVLRDEARAVLQHYRDSGGIVYNGRSPHLK